MLTLRDTIHAIVFSRIELSNTVPMDGCAEVWDSIGDMHDLVCSAV